MNDQLMVNGPTAREFSGQERPNPIGENNRPIAGTLPATIAGEPARSISETNKPRTLEEVVQELATLGADLRRDLCPLSQLSVKHDRLIAGGRELRLDGEGFRRFCHRLGAPADYLATLRPGLRALILKTHLAEGRCVDRNLTDQTPCIISRGDSFLDFGRTDLASLDTRAVLRAVGEGVGADAPTLQVQNLHQGDESFTLELVTPRQSEEVRVGDVICGGLRIQHSFLDGPATRLKAFIVRLICTNGMVQHQCVGEKANPRSTPRTRRLPTSRPDALELQASQLRRMAADIWAMLPKKLEAIRRLHEKKIEVEHVMERFLRQAHVWTSDLMKRLRAAWKEEENEPTAFGALNALTRVATHDPGLEPWQRERLYRLAGIYANQDVHVCKQCYSILTKW
jgi:hypothetical protein